MIHSADGARRRWKAPTRGSAGSQQTTNAIKKDSTRPHQSGRVKELQDLFDQLEGTWVRVCNGVGLIVEPRDAPISKIYRRPTAIELAGKNMAPRCKAWVRCV